MNENNKNAITTRFRTCRKWFETSLHFVWVHVFQKGSNPLQTRISEFMPNTFSQWSTSSWYPHRNDIVCVYPLNQKETMILLYCSSFF